MRRDKIIKLALICVLVGLTTWVAAAAINIGSFNRDTWRLGLDLQGGTHVVYEADFTGIPSEQQSLQLEVAKSIIENRINDYGVAGAIIQIQGNNRISIQLPGVEDPEEAKDLIGATAELDFRKLASSGDEGITSVAAAATAGDTSLVVEDSSAFTEGSTIRITGIYRLDYVIESVNTETNTLTLSRAILLDYDVGMAVTQWVPATGTVAGQPDPVHLTGEYFEPNATPVVTGSITSEIAVSFNLKPEGAALFSEITGDLVGEPLGIFLDNEIISAPTVNEAITNGSGVITGLEVSEAQVLAIQLNQGALPLPLEITREAQVDETLGADSLQKSLIAGIIGLILVLAFMIAYYRLPGLIASVALIIYVLIVLSIFKLVPITLTLAGIAAFVLSIGMAVDANVLIFERMREEIRYGRTVGAAIEAGFDRAWSSIRDSNISTILTCIVLFFFGRALGANVVTGFAITLLIGVLTSMFTAIIITRVLLKLFIGTTIARKISLFYSGSRGHHTDV